MNIKQAYIEFSRLTEYMQSLSLLLARVVVAYGFYQPSMMKWADIDSVAKWFHTLGIPFPLLGTYLAATAEIVGVVLLTLGLFTRVVSVPLIIVMIVAIVSVHLPNGFSVANNGFEIPFYYMIFLFVFLAFGAGRFSLDSFLFEKRR